MKDSSKNTEVSQCGETDPSPNPFNSQSPGTWPSRMPASPSRSSPETQKDDFPYHSPYIGPLHQTEAPALLSLMSPLGLIQTVVFDPSPQVAQFLEFCAAAFDDLPTEADVLKGSRGQEERALALLRNCGGDVTRATYAVMHPCDHVLEVDPPADLLQRVQQATSEFFMAKQADKDSILQNLQDAVSRGTSEQELTGLLAQAKSSKVPIPHEVSESLREAKALAKTVAKRLATKALTWAEVEDYEARFCALPVSTQTSQQLHSYANSAREWRSKLGRCAVDELTPKDLKELLDEAQVFPFAMIELPELKIRYRKLKKWSEAYATLLRLLLKGEHAGTLENALDTVTSLIEAKQTLSEQDLVMSHIEAALSWRERVNMVGEDPKESEAVLQVLEAGADLLLEPADLSVQPGCAELLLKAESMRGQPVDLKELQDLINLAGERGLKAPILDEFQSVLDQHLALRQQAKKVLMRSETVSVKLLEDLMNNITHIPTSKSLDSYAQKLGARLQRAKAWRAQVQAMSERDEWTLKELAVLSREQDKIKVTCEEYEALQQTANNAQKWLNEATNFLSLFPRDKHESGEVDRLRRLINCAPALVQESSEMQELSELATSSETWKEKLPGLFANHEASALETALSEAKTIPASPQAVQELEDKLKLWTWETAVEACLSGEPNLHSLRDLKLQADTNEQRRMPIYRNLVQTLRQAEDWYKSFSATAWNSSRLPELYKSAAENTALSQEKRHVKWTLEMVSMWQWRAKKFLEEGGAFAELTTLLLEANSLRASDELETGLHKLKSQVNAWRKEAKLVLRATANPELAPLPVARPLKRQLLELEYSLQSRSDDIVDDMIDAVENASYISMPSYSIVAAVPHPLQGLSVIYRRQKTKPALPKKNRTAKPTKGDRKVLKSKLFSDDKEDFCICRRELSFDGVMIQCEGCGEWFHPSCLGLETEDALSREGFECRICVLRICPDLQLAEAPFECAYLTELILKGKSLLAKPAELHSLEVLDQRISVWNKSASQALDQRDFLLESPTLQDFSFDATLATLLLEQEGLPVKLPSAPSLLQLLRKRDWARSAVELNAKGLKAGNRLVKNSTKGAVETASA